MSRSHKRQETRSYRAPKGHRRAKMHGLRSVPPSQWDDVKPDDQCYKIDKIIDSMFNKGMQLEEIEKKIKEQYKVPHWQWIEMTSFDFDSTITIHFHDMVALNEDETAFVPLSTPDVEPCFQIEIDYLPIKNWIIITNDKLLRYQDKKKNPHMFGSGGSYVEPNIATEEIYPFPNKKLTKLFLHIRDHFVDNGMEFWYMVHKWKMGLEKCKIDFLEYEE